MKIPPPQLESTKRRLHHLVDERTSALWASYGDEDISVLFRLKDALFAAAAAQSGGKSPKPA